MRERESCHTSCHAFHTLSPALPYLAPTLQLRHHDVDLGSAPLLRVIQVQGHVARHVPPFVQHLLVLVIELNLVLQILNLLVQVIDDN